MGILRWTAIILFFVLVAAMATHSLNSINQDIGRHLKAGQVIWETGQVFKTNLFSFTEPDHPFINHHWLSEVAFYLLSLLIGLKGLIVFKAAAVVAAFFLVFMALPKTARGWPFLLAGIPALLVFSSRTDLRPEIFSYLFLAYFIFAIFRAKYCNETKWLYPLPIIQILWTNSHIYFALGPGLLFLFLIDRLIHRKANVTRIGYYNDRHCTMTVIVVFVLTSLATLFNPNFIRGALAPLTILRDYPYTIVENQTIFLLQNFGIQLKDIFLFEISLIILIISFFIAIKNGRGKITFEFLTAMVFAIMAGKMIRNFGVYTLVFTPIVAMNFDALSPAISRINTKLKAIFYLILITTIVLLLPLIINNSFYKWLGNSKRFGPLIPNGSIRGVEFVKENKITGPVFNNFDVGSMLIWQLYPEQKVFVDGRPEAYSKDFFEKIYKPMQEDPALWKYYSEKYKINYVFIDRNDITNWGRKFRYYISQNHNWPLIYLDANTAIFIKRTSENQGLIQKFEIR